MGRAPRLVHAVAEFWPIEKLNELPDMKGVYVLYDKDFRALDCGEAGRGKQTIRGRISGKKNKKYTGVKVRYFSAFDLDTGLQHQVETLLQHAFWNQLLRNRNWGKWKKTTKQHFYSE